MTSGIYQLNFSNQAYYIGQAQDLQARWKQHADKFIKGKAAKKMQDAYDQLGMPSANVVIECHRDYLDIMENYYIAIQKTYVNCLNTSAPALDSSIDYEWLINNPKLLEFSSIHIIKEAVDLTSQNTRLQDEHDTLKNNFNKAFMVHKAAADLKYGKDENAQLVVEYHDRLRRAQEKITSLLNRGLLDRIFNHQ